METTTTNIGACKEWWKIRRLKYNLGLIIAGFSAFIAYSVLGEILLAPNDNEFEISAFTILIQGFSYLIFMGIANLLYNLGYYIDKHYNSNNSEALRKRLFNLGFWFSVGLPFMIPILVVVIYFIRSA